jgi:hypothetical protein
MKRSVKMTVVTLIAASTLMLGATAAWAGSPHFVDSTVQKTITTTNTEGDTLTATGKEAGLGDETQITVQLSATALCINGGGNHPKAVNKANFSTTATVPVQNGKADFTLGPLVAVFSPSCSPPMTVSWTNITVTDLTNGISTDP